MIKFLNTKKCTICGSEPKQIKKITYGHGESYMDIHFECPICKYKTKNEGNYNGYQEPETVHKALTHWNNMQLKLGEIKK